MTVLHHGGRFGHSASVLIALAEKSIEFESRPVDLPACEQHEAAFLAVNPAGQVPVLEDDGHRLTETFFILQYLDERYPDPPLSPADGRGRYTALKWGKYVETHIAPHLSLFAWAMRGTRPGAQTQARFARLTPERRRLWEQASVGFDESDIETAREAIHKAIGRVAEDLALTPWLAGDRFSIADIAVFPHLARAQRLGFDMPEPVAQWLDRIATRPRVLEVLGKPGTGPDVFTMGPERGRWG